MTNKQRYVVTIGAVLFYFLISRIPLYVYPKGLLGEDYRFLGFFGLGFYPLCNGFISGEILSFFLPPLSRWRKEGLQGRRKIHLTQLFLTFIYAGIQSWSLVLMHISGSPPLQLSVFNMKDLPAQAALMSGLCAGVFIFYYLAVTVNRHGAVNGFILLFLLDLLYDKANNIWKDVQIDLRLIRIGQLPTNPLLGFKFSTFEQKMNAIYLLLAIAGITFLLYQKRHAIWAALEKYPIHRPALTYQTGRMKYQIKGSPIPQTIFGGLMVLPLIYQAFRGKYFLTSLNDRMLDRYILGGVQVIDYMLAVFILWLIFSSRRWVHYQLEQRADWLAGRDEMKKQFLFWFIVISSTYALREFSFGYFVSATFDELYRTLLMPLFFLEVWILGQEIYEKLMFDRRVADRVCMAEMDNVAMVQLWAAQLEEAGIPFHIEGLRYRQITQFFAPYLKMRFFVDKQHIERTSQIIRLEDVKQI